MRLRFAAVSLMAAFTVGCGRYQDFTLPAPGGSGGTASGTSGARFVWEPRAEPVLHRGASGEWDSGDVLNPSVVRIGDRYLNLYSGFSAGTWRTGSAVSSDGLEWKKLGVILAPETAVEGDTYIAANGGVVRFGRELLYYYQGGRTPRIFLAHGEESISGRWRKEPQPVLGLGPYGSWDERGVADPYVIAAGNRLYLYYLGMDRARRQRLGVAMSEDGVRWYKWRGNPVLELGALGTFDENGLGEPAVWSSEGEYWMLYTGRARNEQRRLGMAQSRDGVHWSKRPEVIEGQQPWDSEVVCDPTVLIEGGEVHVWFGGGDRARPDENIDGQIGYGILRNSSSSK